MNLKQLKLFAEHDTDLFPVTRLNADLDSIVEQIAQKRSAKGAGNIRGQITTAEFISVLPAINDFLGQPGHTAQQRSKHNPFDIFEVSFIVQNGFRTGSEKRR